MKSILNNQELTTIVEKKINELIDDFIKHPQTFRYEGDMMARLYSKLAQIDQLIPIESNGCQRLFCLYRPGDAEKDKKDTRSFDLAIESDEENEDDREPIIAIECKFETSLKEIKKDCQKLLLNKFGVKYPYVIIFEKTKPLTNKSLKNLKSEFPQVKIFNKYVPEISQDEKLL